MLKRFWLAITLLLCFGLAACRLANDDEYIVIPHEADVYTVLDEHLDYEEEVDGHSEAYIAYEPTTTQHTETQTTAATATTPQTAAAQVTTTQAATSTAQTEPETLQEEIAEYKFIGNINSLIFHAIDCRSLPAPHNRVYFINRNEAVEVGHRPCLICTP